MTDRAETHVAGLDVTWEGRYLRQRCAWCGTVLLDYDLERVAARIPEDGSAPDRPATWPAGALVRRDGPASFTLEADVGDRMEVPEDCCLQLDPDVTR